MFPLFARISLALALAAGCACCFVERVAHAAGLEHAGDAGCPEEKEPGSPSCCDQFESTTLESFTGAVPASPERSLESPGVAAGRIGPSVGEAHDVPGPPETVPARNAFAHDRLDLATAPPLRLR